MNQLQNNNSKYKYDKISNIALFLLSFVIILSDIIQNSVFGIWLIGGTYSCFFFFIGLSIDEKEIIKQLKSYLTYFIGFIILGIFLNIFVSEWRNSINIDTLMKKSLLSLDYSEFHNPYLALFELVIITLVINYFSLLRSIINKMIDSIIIILLPIMIILSLHADSSKYTFLFQLELACFFFIVGKKLSTKLYDRWMQLKDKLFKPIVCISYAMFCIALIVFNNILVQFRLIILPFIVCSFFYLVAFWISEKVGQVLIFENWKFFLCISSYTILVLEKAFKNNMFGFELNAITEILFFGVLIGAYYVVFEYVLREKLTLKTATVIYGKKRKVISMFLVAGILFTYMLTCFNKTFPISEGWYSWFAYDINVNGKIPYRDFEILFPPLYTYLIAFITKIFGYELIVLRVVGLIIFILIGIVFYLIYQEIFSDYTSVVAAVVSAFFLQSEVAQIFYDYIRFMDLFVLVSILFFVKYIKNIDNEKKNKRYIILSSFFASLASLVKQSSGVMFLAYCLFVMIILMIFATKKERSMKSIFLYIVTMCIPYIILMIYLIRYNIVSKYFDLTITMASSAKGGSDSGILGLLFGWIVRSKDEFINGSFYAIIFISITLYCVYAIKRRKEKYDTLIFNLIFTAIIVSGILICYFSNGISKYFNETFRRNIMYSLILTVAVLFFAGVVYIAFLILRKDKTEYMLKDEITLVYLLGSAFVVAYAVGTSGGVAESQYALSLGIIISFVIECMVVERSVITYVITLVSSCALILSSVSVKYITTYSWWGLNTFEIQENKCNINVPKLKGIRVAENYKRMYEDVYNIVKDNTDDEDSIFAFPHCPIFYVLTGKNCPTYSAVQWFDVSSKKAIDISIEQLIDCAPKIIIDCNIPEFVIQSHENLFNGNQKSGLREMKEELNKLEYSQMYELKGEYILSGDYVIRIYVRIE